MTFPAAISPGGFAGVLYAVLASDFHAVAVLAAAFPAVVAAFDAASVIVVVAGVLLLIFAVALPVAFVVVVRSSLAVA